MKYKLIEPEVVIGTSMKMANSEKKITKLSIELENWFGDDLLEDVPYYIVTDRLKVSLEKSQFTGFEFADAEVKKDMYFEDNYQQDKPLPKFYWLKIVGTKGKDDLYVSEFDLYISEKLFQYLKEKFLIENADIDPIHDKETDDFILSLIKRDKEDQKK